MSAMSNLDLMRQEYQEARKKLIATAFKDGFAVVDYMAKTDGLIKTLLEPLNPGMTTGDWTYVVGGRNKSCQHHHVDNDTWRCEACNERMIMQRSEAKTILSAPNATPCRDPDHLAAMEAGEDFSCTHPYTPDLSRQREIVASYSFTYECERCGNNGTIYTGRSVIWDCGQFHRGADITNTEAEEAK
jgi:ribosomal protein L37AE/L43A